ncbi:unnamed protein product [Heligmosomoides polygyrus]|uniref:HTH_48 domain-containing protein n=1 Tax=Heligmosomoides polygyrus TaxID=6339 RepID=A0A183G930_HELPZ|nr:unnamed protein product [Heligmosomoides polygyrus]
METKMLRWTAGVTRVDHIRNDAIRQKFGVAPIADKMREARLRWYGHVLRGKEDSVRKIATAAHGFGLLPYNKKRRLHAGCVPTSEDFTVDSLRRAPNGCGNLPPRQVLTVLLEENGKKKQSWFRRIHFVCDASFRAECAQQAQIFAEKCRKRKWNVDEMSVVDSFMERLHLKMNEMTERRSGGSLEFLSTVSNNRPFLDVDRGGGGQIMAFNSLRTPNLWFQGEESGNEARAIVAPSGKEKKKSVGGTRASIYNAVTVEETSILAAWMWELMDTHSSLMVFEATSRKGTADICILTCL